MSLLFGLICLGSIFIILLLNKFFAAPSLYDGQLFLIQTDKYSIISILIISIIIYSIIQKYFAQKDSSLNQSSSILVFYYVILISFIYKILLLKFNIITEDISDYINQIFVNGEFNQYKLYSYMAYFVTLLTNNYNIFLTYFNILLGSLTVGYVYKIIYLINRNQLISLITSFLVLLFMPLNMIQLLLRVDSLFIVLFVYTIYTLFTQMSSNNYKHIIILNISVFLLSLCRESTLYMLPLFILIGLFIKENRFLTLASMSLVVIITTSLISSYNLKEYGMKSRVKNYHMAYNLVHYGYFNESMSQRIRGKLSENALELYDDIYKSYIKSVPPHKRSELFTSITWLKPHFRSDTENIVLKSTFTPYAGDFHKSKEMLLSKLRNSNNTMTYEQLEKTLHSSYSKLENNDQKKLTEFLANLLTDVFLLDSYRLSGETKIKCLSNSSNNKDKQLIFITKCVENQLRNIGESYMSSQSDNWSYKRFLLPFVWKFDNSTKKYIQHPQIDSITEIALAMPTLYISQSALTLFGMSGYSPLETGIGVSNQIYTEPIIPIYISVHFQTIYFVLLNLWYLFAFLAILGSIILIKDLTLMRNNILIALIPLYYGSFIVFAAQFEFSRLLLPVVPFIIYNYVVTIALLAKSLNYWRNSHK